MEVAVAMSGGVDSTVAAALLKEAGYQVVGVSMVSWRGSLCCSFEDVTRARLMARRLGIRHYLIDLMAEFRQEIVQPYVEARLRGLTPNPCPGCNARFKFGRMWQALRRRTRADRLASGHYVRLCEQPDSRRMSLKRALDLSRDQSYMLWQLGQEQLRQLLFPLGELTKAQVRERAADFGLHEAAARPDSQDLCFLVPDQETFWHEQAGGRYTPGEIVDSAGQTLGQHKGVVFYTPGQRRGLGVAGGERLYVSRIDADSNRLCVGPQVPGVSRLRLQELNWVSLAARTQALRCEVQVRLHGQHLPALLQADASLREAWLAFSGAIPQVAAGQSVVCYGSGGELQLGGVALADIDS